MSIADDYTSTNFASLPGPAAPIVGAPTSIVGRPLHRVAEIRHRQGISLRSAARRMGTTMEQVRMQEDATCDMKLSELNQWQKALGVPLAELLIDLDPPLSAPVLTRARMLKIMKTVRALKDEAREKSLQRFCTMLEGQLIELMPELEDVSPWHTVGQRRTQDELGRAAERALPDSFFGDPMGS